MVSHDPYPSTNPCHWLVRKILRIHWDHHPGCCTENVENLQWYVWFWISSLSGPIGANKKGNARKHPSRCKKRYKTSQWSGCSIELFQFYYYIYMCVYVCVWLYVHIYIYTYNIHVQCFVCHGQKHDITFLLMVISPKWDSNSKRYIKTVAPWPNIFPATLGQHTAATMLTHGCRGCPCSFLAASGSSKWKTNQLKNADFPKGIGHWGTQRAKVVK